MPERYTVPPAHDDPDVRLLDTMTRIAEALDRLVAISATIAFLLVVLAVVLIT